MVGLGTRIKPTPTAKGNSHKVVMKENRITFLIPRRARVQIIRPAEGSGYFHSIEVKPRFRRQGYGLELMKFALHYTKEFLELDILCQSKVMQRNARRLGYRKTGQRSKRYVGCKLWRHNRHHVCLPSSQLRLLRTIQYKRIDGQTEVVYLAKSLD